MRWLVLMIAVLTLGSCRTSLDAVHPERLPAPIGDIYLPVFPTEVPYSVRLNVRALITAEGTVQTVHLSPRSGNDLWDSLAAEAIKSWQFSPAIQNGRAVSAWIRLPVTLKFAEPQPITLSEIVVPRRELADSLVELLELGQDFGTLARVFSISSTSIDSGYLGPRSLNSLSLPVQMAVTAVGPDHITRPIRSGGNYVIYKRLRDQRVVRPLP